MSTDTINTIKPAASNKYPIAQQDVSDLARSFLAHIFLNGKSEDGVMFEYKTRMLTNSNLLDHVVAKYKRKAACEGIKPKDVWAPVLAHMVADKMVSFTVHNTVKGRPADTLTITKEMMSLLHNSHAQ